MPRLGYILLIATLLVWNSEAQREGCSSSSDFIFVLDSSGSLVDQPLRSNNWAFIQEFLETAVLNIADTVESQYPGASAGLRFALVQFRDIGVITFGLNDFQDFRESARIMGLATNLGGQTNMAAGLEEAEKLLSPQREGNVRKATIIVVSDWSPFNDTVRINSINLARRIERQYGANVITVGVLGSVDRQFLVEVASGGRNVMSEDHNRLINHIAPLISVACETPNQPSIPTGGCVRDIVFVMDGSYSLSQQQDFERLKTFVAQVAGNIYQTASDTRMGVVVFSSTANRTIPLQMYSQDFTNRIQAIQAASKLTNHADAMRKAWEMLVGSDRSKSVIIFTDGMTTEERGAEREISEQMRADGIQIIAFGVSDKIDYATLDKLVGYDKRETNIFWSPNYQSNMIAKLNTLTVRAEGCPARELPCDIRPPEIVVALDASGSIKDKGDGNWRLMQDFGIAVVENIRRAYPDSRVGALTFSDFATEISPLTSDTNTVVSAIRNAKHVNGFTNEADALRMIGRMLQNARNPSYKYGIMVTDGQPTLEQGVEVSVADDLESQGIARVMIGVTSDIKRDRLRRLGSSPSDKYVLFTENFDTLNAVGLITSVVTAAGQCQRPQPTPPPRQCFGADVILVMDSSGSIEEKGKGNFELLKRFTADLARNIANRYTQTRFALVLFSDEGRLISSLSRYTSIAEFVNTVDQQRYSGSQTNIASALRVARTDAKQYGRNNPQIILITDGSPTAETDRTVSEADLTRQDNIQISAVGITYDIAGETLTRITGSSNRVYMTPQFSALQNEIVDVTQVACQEGSRAGSPCSGDTEVVFSLDASGSIEQLSQTAWKDALSLIKSAIRAFYTFNRNTRFGLVIFSDRGRREFGLSGDINELPRLIDATVHDRGRTNIADGIEIARRDVFSASRRGANKILILITDGEPNERVTDTDEQAKIAKRDGIVIVTVGITENGPDYNLLTRIASSPAQVLRSLSFANLNQQIGTLVQASCNSLGTTRASPNNRPFFTTRRVPNRFPFRPVVTTPINRFFPGFPAVFTRPQPRNPFPRGTTPRMVFDIPSRFCNGGYVVLVLDVSSRLHFKTLPDRGIDGMGAMSANIVEVLSRLYRDAKFAVVTYGQDAIIVRDFGDYRSSRELETFLRQLSYTPVYNSNIKDGLAKAKDVLQRVRATNSTTILVTDGVSTIDSGLELEEARQLRSIGSRLVVIAVSKNYYVSQIEAITRNDPVHYVAERYRFDANLLSADYRPCIRNPNNIAALRIEPQKECPNEIVFVIDSSGSMNGNEWDNVKAFLVTLVDKFSNDQPGVKFGSVMFSNQAQLGFYFSNDVFDVKMRIQGLSHLGSGSNIARGLSAARRYVFQDNRAKKSVILVTVSNPSAEISATYEEAQRLRDADIAVEVVGITLTPTKDVLERIAGPSKGVVRINNFSDLQSDVEIDKVVDLSCKAGDNVVVQQPPTSP